MQALYVCLLVQYFSLETEKILPSGCQSTGTDHVSMPAELSPRLESEASRLVINDIYESKCNAIPPEITIASKTKEPTQFIHAHELFGLL